MLNREGSQDRNDVRPLKPPSKHNRWVRAGLALLALLGTSHPLAVPNVYAPRVYAPPSAIPCDIQPSALWLPPLNKNGPPQQTVRVQFEVAEADRAAIPNPAFIEATASLNGTQARVAQTEWLTSGHLRLLVGVPQTARGRGPVSYTVQVTVAGRHCSQQVGVPATPQWHVYVPACADAHLGGGDTERFLQSLLPLAKSGRTSLTLANHSASTWGMASLLAHAGLQGVARDTAPALSQNPGLFWWQGPDGARVLANVPLSDDTAQPATQAEAQPPESLADLITRTADRYANWQHIGRYPANAFLLDCGALGTHRLTPDAIARWNARYAYPHIAGHQDAFFADIAARYGDQLETVRGGFDTHWNASLAENVALTQFLRADAVGRLDAQTMAALATTQEYSPTTNMLQAPLNQALEVLASHINTGPASTVLTNSVEANPYVVVFNPLAWERSAPVTITIASDAPLYLTDLSTGNTIYTQRSAPNTLLFMASDVPALGYKVFRLDGPQPDVAAIQAGAFGVTRDAATGAPILSSARFTLTADVATGGVTIFDKVLSRQWMSGTLDARAILGNQLLYSIDGVLLRPANLAVGVISSGPVAAQLQITGQFTQGSIASFTQTATLLNGLPVVLFENTISKMADRTACGVAGCPVERLHFAYPIDLTAPEVRADVLGGITHLGTDLLPGVRRDDYAVQSFVNVSAGELGATLAMPDSPFVEIDSLRTQQGFRTQPISGQLFGLAYATTYSTRSALPGQATPSSAGPLRWRFGWMPHAAGFDAVESVKFGWSQRAPLLTWRLPANQQGPLPGTRRSYAPIATGSTSDGAIESVVVSAFKPAYEGEGLILRLWNPTSSAQTVNLDLGALGVQQLQLADGLERPISAVEPALNTRPIVVPAYGFVTLRLGREGLPTGPPIAAEPTATSSATLPPTRPPLVSQPTLTPSAIGEPLPTAQRVESPVPVALPSATLPQRVDEATATPLATAAPAAAAVTPPLAPTTLPTTLAVLSSPISVPTTLPETPVVVASATVINVNAGGTPTVQATPQSATALPPAPATAVPLVSATAITTVPAPAAAPAPALPSATVPALATGTSTVVVPTPAPTTPTPGARPLAVLDSFDRPDGGVGSGWTGNTSRFAIRNNQLITGTSGNDIYNVMYWTAMLSATQAVAVKFAEIALDDSANRENSAVRLMLKWQGTTIAALRCNAVRVTYDLSDNRVTVEYCDNEANIWEAARNGAFGNVTFAAGDTFGAQMDVVGAVHVFKNGVLIGTADVGGVNGWNFVESETGRVGLWYNDISSVALDDFAGQ